MATKAEREAELDSLEVAMLEHELGDQAAVVIYAARTLEIGPAFAGRLAASGKLPGVVISGGGYTLDRQGLGDAIAYLPGWVQEAQRGHGEPDPKWGLNQGEVPPVVAVPELGAPWDWPWWMKSGHQCGACHYDGRYNQTSFKQPCYGFEPSRYMRSK